MRCRYYVIMLAMAVLCSPSPLLAIKVTTETVTTKILEYPEISIKEVDYADIKAMLAVGTINVGEKEQKQTKTVCVPKGSKNRIKDAIEMPTYYYEVHYESPQAILVVEDKSGRTIYATEVQESIKNTARYGYDQCRHWMPSSLEKNFLAERDTFFQDVNNQARENSVSKATQVVNDALFFRYVKEEFKLARAVDDDLDYSDLDQAFQLAQAAYENFNKQGSNTKSIEDLKAAITIWEKALTESDMGDKKARINQKVTPRLHENIGVASMFINDYQKSILHFNKSLMLKSFTFTSAGMGAGDLVERAKARKKKYDQNRDLPVSQEELAQLVVSGQAYLGKIQIAVLGHKELAELASEYKTFKSQRQEELIQANRQERQEAVASGKVNPFESQVQKTTLQGYFLHINPYYGGKHTVLPKQICELKHLNQLYITGNTIETLPPEIGNLKDLSVLNLKSNNINEVPPEIGNLQKLKKLNLSKNKLSSLPDEIGNCSSLKSLNLKNNNFSPNEKKRIKNLLPSCKVKF